MTPTVVLGMTATGLSVARSLGRKGIKVYGLDSKRQMPGMFSRYVKPMITPNAIENEREFINYLIAFGKRLSKPAILLCAHDEYIGAVSKNREELEPYFKFNIPSKETVENFLDKRRSYIIAKECGLDCPATYFVENIDELKNIIDQLRFPCGLKPAISHLWGKKFGGKKLILIESAEQLFDKFSKIKKEYSQIMIQELIPGKDDQIYIFCAYKDAHNKVLATFTGRKLRQHPIHFGIGCYLISERNKIIEKICLEFLNRINYTGLACVELKCDLNNGNFKFIELNTRFPMFNELLTAAGIDLPYIAYRDLTNKKPEETISFKENVKLVNLELDLGSFWQYKKVKEITLFRYLKSFIGGKVVHTYFVMDDLMPFLFESRIFLKTIVNKFIKRITRKPKELTGPAREIIKWTYSFIPLRIRNGNRFFKELGFLENSQWWSKEELENYQNEKLRTLIKHAYENVPYYHKLFKQNKITSDDIKTIKDLPKIPILTKDLVRKNPNLLVATNFKKNQLKKLYTSGTTGLPLFFYADKNNEYLTGAPVQWRYFSWGDYNPQNDIMAVFGEYNLKPKLNGQRRLFQYNPISKWLHLSINDLTKENIGKYVLAIEKYQPLFFKSFPSSLERFANLLKEKSIKLSINPAAIFTNSEILYHWQRELIENYFRCGILDWYGMEERVMVATECSKHIGYHIASEYGVVEFAKYGHFNDQNGNYEIIATGLTNFGMPLIRYKTGDLGFPIASSCTCGRGLPLIRINGGRERNFAIAKNGSLIPLTVIDIPGAAENIYQYQFIQEKIGELCLNVIKKDTYKTDDTDKIKTKLNEKFGDNMNIDLRFVDSIPLHDRGKLSIFVQKIKVQL